MLSFYSYSSIIYNYILPYIELRGYVTHICLYITNIYGVDDFEKFNRKSNIIDYFYKRNKYFYVKFGKKMFQSNRIHTRQHWKQSSYIGGTPQKVTVWVMYEINASVKNECLRIAANWPLHHTINSLITEYYSSIGLRFCQCNVYRTMSRYCRALVVAADTVECAEVFPLLSVCRSQTNFWSPTRVDVARFPDKKLDRRRRRNSTTNNVWSLRQSPYYSNPVLATVFSDHRRYNRRRTFRLSNVKENKSIKRLLRT